VAEVHGNRAKVELAEGVVTNCQLKPKQETASTTSGEKASDVSALGAMLAARWKQGPASNSGGDAVREGQMRSFRIVNLDSEKHHIEIELLQ
jgi:hypothetical protein